MGILLEKIHSPEDLKSLSRQELDQLCEEMRELIIRTVSNNGGHLASNLGVVELAVAIGLAFQPDRDGIVWDVGHQSYPYKLLTGRYGAFHTLRQEDGLSGFPNREESSYDHFTSGHSSTSISSALGLSEANHLQQKEGHVVAVIGDGALTGGLAFEGLNNAGQLRRNLIVILNDNTMSISKNVGSLARYLSHMRTRPGYIKAKSNVEDALRRLPLIGRPIAVLMRRVKRNLKKMLYSSNIFTDLGFAYYGPFDGHNIRELTETLESAKLLHKPVLLHVRTYKGKGYQYAEQSPTRYHGLSGFDVDTGDTGEKAQSFSDVLGQTLCELAERDSRICAVTAAMAEGTGLSEFRRRFRGRFYDVGIAEEHAVTFACGLAAGGMLPVFAVYSTFLQRGFDQLIHDAAIEQQHVLLAVDRAGLVGDDGETHQGMFDAAFLSQIPGTTVYSPATFADLRYAMQKALYETDGLVAVRYPRGGEPTLSPKLPEEPAEWLHLKYGGETLVISYGREFGEVYRAAQSLAERGKTVDLLKLHRIAPLPEACIALAKRYRTILFVEEGIRSGGIGEHFLSRLSDAGYIGRMTIQAVENPFLPQMSVASALHRCGLDSDTLEEQIAALYF